ncbi:MAG: hypothetical protein SLAVMIC_00394 [uncultured marine phage]|uniref:Uncharacterized protein n=1 Tax=uncultured marine phage TaxID=707152 RepID=A0A8D9C8V0_9VIRU|nr:MAG: hypothetical protein SLAVMIC_00394 [uncultured marine phage]
MRYLILKFKKPFDNPWEVEDDKCWYFNTFDEATDFFRIKLGDDEYMEILDIQEDLDFNGFVDSGDYILIDIKVESRYDAIKKYKKDFLSIYREKRFKKLLDGSK